jgi:hypothetical protein
VCGAHPTELIENWNTDEMRCGIGPAGSSTAAPPGWGDGVVDIEDLKVFTAEWEKANPPAQP